MHLQRLLKLHQATPAPVVYFLAGSLPFIALLHLRIFSLFGQLCRLRHGENILATQALNVLSAANGSSKSWFWKLRQLSLQYDYPNISEDYNRRIGRNLCFASTQMMTKYLDPIS